MNPERNRCLVSASAERLTPAGSRMQRARFLLQAILREIFDESAYCRFLARKGLISSPVAYRDFLREQDLAKARRLRCC